MSDKPVIDELIEQNLTGIQKERAIEFVQFIRSNKLEPQWGAKNSYNVKFKAKRVCIIKINKDELDIRLGAQYNEAFNECFKSDDEETIDYLLKGITYCSGCGTCKPGITGTILNHAIQNACFNPVIQMINPDEKKLALAKRLVVLRKEAVALDTVPKTTYIGIKKRK